jgi:Rrf2 family protein
MLRINKASEYGVLALRYIGGKGDASSAREISEALTLPYELTAKTLQRLKEAGFIGSSMGTKGGYLLVNPLSEISFAQVIDALEGPIAIVECAQHEGNECTRNSTCELKDGMKILNQKIRGLLEQTKLIELVSMETRA